MTTYEEELHKEEEHEYPSIFILFSWKTKGQKAVKQYKEDKREKSQLLGVASLNIRRDTSKDTIKVTTASTRLYPYKKCQQTNREGNDNRN